MQNRISREILSLEELIIQTEHHLHQIESADLAYETAAQARSQMIQIASISALIQIHNVEVYSLDLVIALTS